MRIQITFILLTLLVLAACNPSDSASPTPTIVRLDRSALTPSPHIEAAGPPLSTSTPGDSPTVTSLSLVAAPTATVTVQPEALEISGPTTKSATVQAEIITAGLNVREGPGVNYEVIGAVAQGDILDVTGVSADSNWLQIVTAEGEAGWISGQSVYTRIHGSLDDMPVIKPPAAGLPSAIGSQQSAVGGQPSAVASGGKLVFATSSGGDLYAVNADGAGLQKLASEVIDPVVSPDGQQVAFTRWDGAEFGTLYVMNFENGEERAVLSETRQAKSPIWSPDGQDIIVSFQHGGLRDPGEKCRTFESGQEVNIPNSNITITDVDRQSDGGVKICYIPFEDLQWGLRRVNLATGQFEDLPADLYAFSPTWDPQNPSRVIYDGERGLMQLDVATGELQPFTTDVRDTAPVFSPDGQTLALTYKQHDHWEVYTYDLDSGVRERLTKPPILADPQYNSAAPAWSPDGSQIAFVTDRGGQYPGGTTWEIWVMNADGSNQHPLFSTEAQAQLGLQYNGVNERLLNWVGSSSTPTATDVTPTAAGQVSEALEVGTATNASLNGRWDFSFGAMSLTQRDSRVEGVYQWYGGADTGQIEGIVVGEPGQFQGIWISDRNPNSQSLLRWRLAANGSSISGASEGGSTTEQWCGVPSGQPLPDGCGFSGTWQLRFGNPPGVSGQATLAQNGQTVTGTYVDNRGHRGEIVAGVIIVESITEMKLTGVWRNDQGEQDTFEWRLDLTTGRTFQGRRNPGNSEWCGWREGGSEPEQCGW
jgi:hypothetical protein